MATINSIPGLLKELSESVHYNPETGKFSWVKGKRAGRHSGSIEQDGYIRIQMRGATILAHNLATYIMTGSLPVGGMEVDHINGNRSDNRWSNLRIATRQQNSRNSAIKRNNTSGHKGVTWDKSRGKWIAGIKVDYKRINLGRFDRLEDAVLAYREAAERIFGEFAVHKRCDVGMLENV